MSARRKAIRQRDIVSYGRRTPRFDFLSLREEAKESARPACVLSLSPTEGRLDEAEKDRPRVRSDIRFLGNSRP